MELFRDNTRLDQLTTANPAIRFQLPIVQSGSYQIAITTASSSVTTSFAPITVEALLKPELTNDGPLSCSKTTVTLTASGGSSYTFVFGKTVLGTPGPANTISVSSRDIYEVRVATPSGCTSSTTTSVTSNTAAVSVNPPTMTNATVGTAFSQAFTATGGAGPYAFSLARGSLPTGLNLALSGVLSGTPTQSGSYTLTVQARDANGCLGTASAYILTVGNSPLPVTLTGFTARRFSEQAVGLEWQTSQESGAAYFEVQRSLDAREFTAIERVTAQGNTMALTRYRYMDYLPLVSTIYYRLRLVDQDGTFRYSPIASVPVDESAPLLRLVANPVATSRGIGVWLRGFSQDALRLSSLSGLGLAIQVHSQSDGSMSLQPLFSLSPGLYVIQAGQGAGALSVRLVE